MGHPAHMRHLGEDIRMDLRETR